MNSEKLSQYKNSRGAEPPQNEQKFQQEGLRPLSPLEITPANDALGILF